MSQENTINRSLNYFITDVSSLENLKLKNFKKTSYPEGMLRTEDNSRPAYAEFEIKTPFYFNEVICSVSAGLSDKDSIEPSIEINGEEFSCGRFSPGASESSSKKTAAAFMDTDTLRLSQKASTLKVKINLYNNSGTTDTLKLINLVLTDNTLPYDKTAADLPADFSKISIQVPAISQMAQQIGYSGDICSPTSLAMIFNKYGIRETPINAAQKVADSKSGIYGDWLFNTGYASSKGLFAFVARINSVEEAYDYLKRGIPLVASVTFGPDELPNSPLKKTKGHLLVIKGMDAKGDFIVNDPAAPEDRKVEIVYPRKEFAGAWLKNKFGTAYVITDDMNDFLSPSFPFSELFSVTKDKNGTKKEIETQILPDEITLVIKTDEWVKVELPGQKTTDKKNKETPYSGYIDKSSFSLPLRYEAVVINKEVYLYDLSFSKTNERISMGAKISAVAYLQKDGEKFVIAQSGAKIFLLKASDISTLTFKGSSAEAGEKILQRARQFIGDPYYLGGRTSFGVDCSGLVGLVYRTLGFELPRNAKDQFLKLRPAEHETLRPGDLVFSTAADSDFINHVMIYSGNGKIIESTQDSNSVREITLEEKFGTDFKKLRSGIKIKGKKIYFRAVLPVDKKPQAKPKNYKKTKTTGKKTYSKHKKR